MSDDYKVILEALTEKLPMLFWQTEPNNNIISFTGGMSPDIIVGSYGDIEIEVRKGFTTSNGKLYYFWITHIGLITIENENPEVFAKMLARVFGEWCDTVAAQLGRVSNGPIDRHVLQRGDRWKRGDNIILECVAIDPYGYYYIYVAEPALGRFWKSGFTVASEKILKVRED